ncbi:MAG: exopolysaccharide biosynthesis polyprenyl glycosylphosphotransferase [Gemmataceae bacterium]
MHAEGNVTAQPPVTPAAPTVARPRTTLLPRPVTVVPAVTWYNAVKRLFDLAMALTLLMLSLPIVLVAALLVKLTSRGPAFYSQTRVGLGGRPFTIWKLRSMVVDSEKHGVQWCKKGDPRVTTVGRFLRRSHIDELPQLWNILRGDMSLVGPRPERPEFVPQLEAAIPGYKERLHVLPGVTGLAQIHLEADTDLASVERKLAMDLYYVKTLSFWTDLRIVLATVVHVFKPHVADKWFFRLTPQSCAKALARQ